MHLAPERASSLQELRQSWVTLLACSFGASVGAAAFPLFLVPVVGLSLEAKFGWTRLDTSSLTSIAFIGGAIGVPIAGWLSDRWSIKKPVVFSMLAIGVMLILASFAPPGILAWRAGIFLLMLSGAGTLSAAFIKIVCEHFDAMRGLALGITVGSISFVSAIALPWFTGMIAEIGVERFFVASGIAYLVVIAPLLWVLLPDSRPRKAKAATAHDLQNAGDTKPSALWLLGFAGFLLSIITGSAAHLAAVAADGGSVSPALVGSMFAVGVMVSRPLAGFAIDFLNARYIGAAAAALAAVGLVVAALLGDRYIILSALLLSVTVGAEFDIVAFLASKYASPSLFGRAFGWMYSSMLLAAALGPVVIALQLDLSGSYRVPFLSAALIAAIAAAMLLLLPSYARPGRE